MSPKYSLLDENSIESLEVTLRLRNEVEFDSNQLNVEPLTCSSDDANWKVELLDGVEKGEGISSFEISNQGSASTFELQSTNSVKLGSQALNSL